MFITWFDFYNTQINEVELSILSNGIIIYETLIINICIQNILIYIFCQKPITTIKKSHVTNITRFTLSKY